MYVDSYEFKDWMQKLLDKLEEVGKDVKSLQTNPEVMPNDKLLDNQDLCLLFKVSTRTLQKKKKKKLFLKSTLEVTSFHICVTNIYGVCSTG